MKNYTGPVLLIFELSFLNYLLFKKIRKIGSNLRELESARPEDKLSFCSDITKVEIKTSGGMSQMQIDNGDFSG